MTSEPRKPGTSPPVSALTTGQAIVAGWLLSGVLDIAAAAIQVWVQAGRTPAALLRGVASALWGTAALEAGTGMAVVGLAMHFGVALAWTLVFFWIAGRASAARTAPLWVVGPLYGLVVFFVMNYATLPALSFLRSLYLDIRPSWPGSMGWQQAVIHMVCVGTPIAWAIRRTRSSGS